MEHVLDNPVWNALVSGNKHLAKGTNEVKWFDITVSPFIGLAETSPQSFQQLYQLIPRSGPVGFVTHRETVIPNNWQIINHIPCLQMVCEHPATAASQTEIYPLTLAHVPQMLALTKLTNPGPFTERTIEFGHYYGIFDGSQLVAMAGQRMHIFDYAEISAVCTHPDYLGRGYAKHLLLFQANRIKAAGGIPMLHVRHDNHRAIKVYESVGFKKRSLIHFYILAKHI